MRGKQRPGSFVTSMIRRTTTYLVLETLSLGQHTFGTVAATRQAIRRERLSIKDMAQSRSCPPAKTRVEKRTTTWKTHTHTHTAYAYTDPYTHRLTPGVPVWRDEPGNIETRREGDEWLEAQDREADCHLRARLDLPR